MILVAMLVAALQPAGDCNVGWRIVVESDCAWRGDRGDIRFEFHDTGESQLAVRVDTFGFGDEIPNPPLANYNRSQTVFPAAQGFEVAYAGNVITITPVGSPGLGLRFDGDAWRVESVPDLSR